ncbi:MAG: sulfur carrier protein ThiS [Dehalococcoidia bacterium]|jgi:sulfur carrier protein|nr:sulfur carrier protein ThiS [Dehalococcoidia bacterium]MDP7200311.1 sulfur carrier protein ThiS [Dehalococcoidia bacterium]
MINLTVNGKAKALEASLDLAAFLAAMGVNQEHVAVGYNGEVIKKELYPEVQLRDGDVLEIVRPVGGG